MNEPLFAPRFSPGWTDGLTDGQMDDGQTDPKQLIIISLRLHLLLRVAAAVSCVVACEDEVG